jgi:hypothetical protein
MINQPNPSLEGDGDLYCQLPRTGRPGRNSGGSNRSAGIRGVVRRSSSFSSDIHLSSETSPIKKDGSVSVTVTERSSSAVSTKAEDSPKYTARNAETRGGFSIDLHGRGDGSIVEYLHLLYLFVGRHEYLPLLYICVSGVVEALDGTLTVGGG